LTLKNLQKNTSRLRMCVFICIYCSIFRLQFLVIKFNFVLQNTRYAHTTKSVHHTHKRAYHLKIDGKDRKTLHLQYPLPADETPTVSLLYLSPLTPTVLFIPRPILLLPLLYHCSPLTIVSNLVRVVP
jgi:hypothetical protein